MKSLDKKAYIIAGPNGAGKTTFVSKYLPKYAHICNFVNADNIASGLSPFDYSSMQIKAGKIMLEMLDEFTKKGESFGFETTLAGKRWNKLIKNLRQFGYEIHLFYLSVVDVNLCIKRVKNRVLLGGHNIDIEVIKRRYVRSKHNFIHLYKNNVDYWYLFDTSTELPQLIATNDEIMDRLYLGKFMGGAK